MLISEEPRSLSAHLRIITEVMCASPKNYRGQVRNSLKLRRLSRGSNICPSAPSTFPALTGSGNLLWEGLLNRQIPRSMARTGSTGGRINMYKEYL